MKLSIFILILMMSFFMASMMAVTRHVPSEFTTIQAALNASTEMDTVLVAPGTYLENINWPQVDSISLISSGTRENTIIDGNHLSRVIGMISSWDARIISRATLISGFTIRNGYGSMNGAGICCVYAAPTLRNLIISFNSVSVAGVGAGGGLYCNQASPLLENVIIVHNNAYSGGGAHIDPGSSPTFNNCVIADNTLYSTGGSYAAGIYGRYQVYFQLNHCTIARNRFWGTAAIHLGEVCNPTISLSTITDNYKGILVVHDGSVILQNSNITDNDNAGLELYNAAPVTVQNNWWGAASGPYHVSVNPSGLGDTIIGDVNFTPWLNVPVIEAPLTPPLGLVSTVIGNNVVSIQWLENPESNVDHYEVNYGPDTLAVILPYSMNINNDARAAATISDLISGTYYAIQVAAVDSDSIKSWYSKRIVVRTTGTATSDPIAPTVFLRNYPNPFIGSTSISYDVKQPGDAALSIYNLKGQLVKTLFNGHQVPGLQQVSWDGRNDQNQHVSSGMYFARLECRGKMIQSKMILLK